MKTRYENELEAKVKKGQSNFIAGNATVLGKVELGDFCSVWYNAVIRGDSDSIRIGNNTNIQDGAVLHVDPGEPVEIGTGVTVGHGAIVHGATVEDDCLIGMRSTILNGAKIGKNSIIGAHALVTGGTEIPPRSLVLGSPGKIVKELSDDEIRGIKRNAEVYVEKCLNYQDQ